MAWRVGGAAASAPPPARGHLMTRQPSVGLTRRIGSRTAHPPRPPLPLEGLVFVKQRPSGAFADQHPGPDRARESTRLPSGPACDQVKVAVARIASVPSGSRRRSSQANWPLHAVAVSQGRSGPDRLRPPRRAPGRWPPPKGASRRRKPSASRRAARSPRPSCRGRRPHRRSASLAAAAGGRRSAGMHWQAGQEEQGLRYASPGPPSSARPRSAVYVPPGTARPASAATHCPAPCWETARDLDVRRRDSRTRRCSRTRVPEALVAVERSWRRCPSGSHARR